MDSVVIVAPHPYDEELKLRLERRWKISDGSCGGWVVEDGGERVYVIRNDAVGDELEPEMRERIMEAMHAPIFYNIDFSDIELCRRVLASIADDPNLLIDNDHGVLLPGSDFVRVLRSRRDWDWRRDIA